MGKAFAQLLNECGHSVILGCRLPLKSELEAWSNETNISCVSVSDAMQSADIILLALPYESALIEAEKHSHLASKIVIDISNPVTADLKEMVVGFSTSAAEQIQKLMPECKVVKAFNTIIATLVPKAARTVDKVQTLIASDNEMSKKTIINLAESLGFDPVDAGALTNARYIEPVAQMTIHLACFQGWGFTVSPSWKAIQ
ncbi:NADPH-dependent F420 reductase [Vibrio tritonius]|uniref:NADPH-dependent F420 reductase n=1 Tax=Vibrio tritonius TaxID=1435069 RepID=UPI00315D04B6